MAILGTIIGKGAVRMEAHERVLHELLKMGEMLLGCGAEINRVEDTMMRLGRAYGAKRVDIFVITSDIVLTVLFDDGAELTQTRRISGSPATDFVKLEVLNALSRKVCAAPVSAAELHEALCAIDEKRPSALRSYLGSVLTALGFTLFLGGGIADALFAGAVGAMVCWMQRKVMPVFRNGAFFQMLTGLLAGAVICLAGRLSDVFAVDKMSIGVIMLLIPGAALTNAVRDMLDGLRINTVLGGKQVMITPDLNGGSVDFFEGAGAGNPEDLEAATFTNAILGKGKLYVTADQAAVVTQILEGIYESDKTGKPYYFA